MKRMKRTISLVLSFALLAGYIPAPVHAEDLSQQGLCEHHTEHIGCSYSPAVEEQTCQHQCSDDCYTKEEACQHTHDGCETGDTPCDHVCSEGNGCITKKLACAHEHDEVCGYAEPKDAVNCDYECAKCSCSHTWDNGIVTQEATADVPGVRTYTCSSCGEIKTEDVTYVATVCNHTWDEGVVDTETTVTAPGKKIYTCSDCGDTKTEEIPQLVCEHEWNDGEFLRPAEDDTPATFLYTCTLCGLTEERIAEDSTFNSTLYFAGGSGTEDSPYLVSTAEHLDNVRLYPSAHFELINNIYLTSQDYTYSGDFYNSGSYWDPIDDFTGSFNGNNYVIDGLKMNRSYSGERINNAAYTTGYFGLFGNVEGDIFNLTLSNVNIQIYASKYTVSSSSSFSVSVYVGGIAGSSFGEIANCTVSGAITVTGNTDFVSANVGGLVGRTFANGSIHNSRNEATVQAVCTKTTYQYGSGKYISGSTATAGGIVGYFQGSAITDSINYGSITANSIKSPEAGGIAGVSSTNYIDGEINTQISGCYNYGDIVAASNPPTSMDTSSYNYGELYAQAGGIVAYMTESSVIDCGNDASVTARGWGSYAGGIAGDAYSSSEITQCFNKGSILSSDTYTTHYGSHNAGGITGNRGLIDQSYNTGSVSSTGTDYVKAGGITTCTFDKITNCYNAGTITAQTDAYDSRAAGIIVDLPTAIEYCYNVGALNGTKKGGIVCTVYDGTSNTETERHILDCYFIDNVSVGVYETADSCTINTYKKSESAMKNQSTFLHFDFEEVWTFHDKDYQFPQLAKFATGHNFGEWTVTKKPTCTEKGQEKRSCSCGKVESREIDILGHTEVIDEAVAATCTQIGLTEGKHCSICQEVTVAQKEIPAGHKVTDGICTMCKAYGTCGEFLTWQFDEATGKLTISGSGSMSDFEIVKFITSAQGEVNYPWLNCRTGIQTVEIQSGVTSIGSYAFYFCENLQSIEIADSVATIGESAFQNCEALESVVIPNGVTAIATNVFRYCSSLQSVNIPENVTKIESSVFENCSALKSIVIPDQVTIIDALAFKNCHELASVTLGSGVSEIFWGAFQNCSSLTSITIPSGVTTLSDGVFNGCTSLENVSIPVSVNTIESGAFYRCSNLQDVYYGGSSHQWDQISIDNSSNYNDELLNATIHFAADCSKGHSFDSNNTCTVCGLMGGICGDDATWTYDAATGTLTISGTGNMYDYDSGGKKAPWHVYRDQIKALDIGTGVTYIGEDAFYECYVLSSVTVPNSVNKIGSGAFLACSSLTAITLPDQLESIKDYTFSQCAALADITIPESVKTIGKQAFNSCLLLKDITIPATVTSIDDSAFYNCRNLQTMTFLGKAPQISDSAFTDVENLTAYYPANDTSWANVITKQYGGKVTWVAVGAPTLANIRISAPPVKRLYIQNKDALDVTGGKLILTYSDRSTEVIDMTADMVTGFDNTKLGSQKLTVTYGGFTVYLTVTVRVDIDATSGTWGNLNWNIDESGTLTISGTGEMVHFMDGWEDLSVPPIDGYLWHRHADSITSIVVKEGVTSLAEIAFHGLKNLTSVTLPDSLVTIDDAAFAFCTSLESITMPANVATIGQDIFIGSTSFKEITFVGNAPSFDAAAFEEITATAIYPAANKSWTEDVLKDYGGHVTWVPYGLVNNRLVLDLSELGGQTTVWIDGIACEVHISGSKGYVEIPHEDAKTMVIYTYHVGDANDVHTQYPISMKVWALEKQEDGSYKANRVEALDDILQYSGSSIRITGNKGIRMITSVPQEKKNAMVSGDLAGYKLLEYGTVLAQVSKMADGPLVLGPEYAKSNYAYKRGVADPVFAYAGDLVQYTNVLVGFTNDQCKEDIAMRPYMILENEKGEQVTLYGGIVYRSIGYIAYQNRSVFAVGSAAYNYVWEIIHHVYGDKYDAEYKG